MKTPTPAAPRVPRGLPDAPTAPGRLGPPGKGPLEHVCASVWRTGPLCLPCAWSVRDSPNLRGGRRTTVRPPAGTCHTCMPAAQKQEVWGYLSPELPPTARWASAPESWPCPGGSQGTPGGWGGCGSLASELTPWRSRDHCGLVYTVAKCHLAQLHIQRQQGAPLQGSHSLGSDFLPRGSQSRVDLGPGALREADGSTQERSEGHAPASNSTLWLGIWR